MLSLSDHGEMTFQKIKTHNGTLFSDYKSSLDLSLELFGGNDILIDDGLVSVETNVMRR